MNKSKKNKNKKLIGQKEATMIRKRKTTLVHKDNKKIMVRVLILFENQFYQLNNGVDCNELENIVKTT